MTAEQADTIMNAALSFTESNEPTASVALKRALKKYLTMRKVGVPLAACVQAMTVIGKERDGLTDQDIQAFQQWCAQHTDISSNSLKLAFPPTSITTSGRSSCSSSGGGESKTGTSLTAGSPLSPGSSSLSSDLIGTCDVDIQQAYIERRSYGLSMGAILQKMTISGQLDGINTVKFRAWCAEWEQDHMKGETEQRRLNGETKEQRTEAEATLNSMLSQGLKK